MNRPDLFKSILVSAVVLLAQTGRTAPIGPHAHVQAAIVDPSKIQPAPDLSTPEKALASMTAAIFKGEWDTAVRCVAGAVPSEFSAQLNRAPKTLLFALRVANLSTKNVAVDRIEATFVIASTVSKQSKEQLSDPETLSLRKGADGWQIVPMDRSQFRPGQNGMLTEMSFVLANPDVPLAARKRAEEDQARAEAKMNAIGERNNNPPGLEIGKSARLYLDGDRTPIFVGSTKSDAEVFKAFTNLKQMRIDNPDAFRKSGDGFTNADYDRALSTAKTAAAQLTASGAVRLFPHGTRVKILAHVVSRANLEYLPDSNNMLQRAQDTSNTIGGVWQVEVLGGKDTGERVWTFGVVTDAVLLGDYVVLRVPENSGKIVPAGRDNDAAKAFESNWPAVGGDSLARLQRLTTAKRIVTLPVGQRCAVYDATMDGTLQVKPLDGPLKGKLLFVRPRFAELAP